jgi:hypothetical protein
MFAVAWVAACAPSIQRMPAEPDRMLEAEVPNIPGARYWRSEPPDNIDALVSELLAQRTASGIDADIKMLALSGGADDGAFGAGVLAAWSDRGDRPEFHLVTGVSTGALSAPFVFLGSDWDDELKRIYGGFPSDRIFRQRLLINILPDVSAADPAPLKAIIAEDVTEEFLELVAAEHRRGRRLLVQTTNLDAQEAMIWDMGVIAGSGAPNAVELFRDVLMASASVPGAFPPVLIEATIDGEIIDEMHVDGGVASESTLLEFWQADLEGVFNYRPGTKLEFYVIRNGRIAPERRAVDYNLLSIAGRSASTLIKNLGTSDLLAAYNAAQLRSGAIYMTWIGEDFDAQYPGPFDPEYMQALFDYGYDLMARGVAWSSKPPQLMTAEERRAALFR